MSELNRVSLRRWRAHADTRQASANYQPARAAELILSESAPLSAESVLALQRTHGNHSVGAMLSRRAASAIQRIDLKEDEELSGLELENVTAASVIHGDDESAVWEITAGGASYILKLSSEKPKAELAGTLLAGILGISVARIARHTVTDAEVKAIEAVAAKNDETKEGLESLRAGTKGLLMQKLGGTDLDRLKEQGGVSQQQGFDRAHFMRQLGELAAVDAVVGIGDRFKLPGIKTGNINPGNILSDQGQLHGIDYDVEQGLWGQNDKSSFRANAIAMLQAPQQIAQIVLASLNELAPDLKPAEGDDALILAGTQQVVQRLAQLTDDDLKQLREQGNALLAGYGDHVSALIARATGRELQNEGGEGKAQETDDFADFDFVNENF